MFMYLLISSREFVRKEAVSRPWGSCWTASVPEPRGQAESGLTRTRTLGECWPHRPGLEALSFGIWTVLGGRGQMYGGQVP